jgi:protein-disulfide isomerase
MLQPATSVKDHVSGNLSASVILTEYGDYQCPHCGHAHPVVQRLIKHFGDKMAFVFRNFPLSDIHEMALPAALSTEAADEQGKFWELHNAVFDNQEKLFDGPGGLAQIIRSVGLDPVHIEQQWEDKTLVKKVNDDFESGILSGVNGTPTFYINGKKYDGLPQFADLRDALAAHV